MTWRSGKQAIHAAKHTLGKVAAMAELLERAARRSGRQIERSDLQAGY